MTVFKDFTKVRYPPVGRCIYCGSTGVLGREHIIPAGLGGTATLPKASCAACGKVTGEVERHVLRDMLWPVRVLRRLRLKEAHRAPKTCPVTAVRNGLEEVLHLPIDECPVILQPPVFARPAVGGGPHVEYGLHLLGNTVIGFGPRPEATAERLGVTKLTWRQEMRPAVFARMIAKIAYSYAVAELGLDAFAEAPICDEILGHSDKLGHWLGTIDQSPVRDVGILHRVTMHYDASSTWLGVLVHLFADSQFPTYLVVVGRLVKPPVDSAA